MNDETIKDYCQTFHKLVTGKAPDNCNCDNCKIFRKGYEEGKKEAREEIKKLKAIIIRRIKIEEHCDNCEKGFECDTCKPHFDSIRKSFDNKIQSLTSQPQTPQKNSQSPTSDCSKLAGESLRAKYCDECKTKQGEEDVA